MLYCVLYYLVRTKRIKTIFLGTLETPKGDDLNWQKNTNWTKRIQKIFLPVHPVGKIWLSGMFWQNITGSGKVLSELTLWTETEIHPTPPSTSAIINLLVWRGGQWRWSPRASERWQGTLFGVWVTLYLHLAAVGLKFPRSLVIFNRTVSGDAADRRARGGGIGVVGTKLLLLLIRRDTGSRWVREHWFFYALLTTRPARTLFNRFQLCVEGIGGEAGSGLHVTQNL